MTPLVSILIPAHNAGAWIAETIDSCLAQTWPRIEVVVVDDGSTDSTLNIARSYESKGVRVFSQENMGASSARNRAWDESRGEWLQFLDADDLLEREKVAAQMALAEALGGDFAYCSRWTRFSGSIAGADHTPQPLCTDSDPLDWLIIKLRDDAMMHPAAWLLSRSLAEAAGRWDGALTLDDDGEFFSRVVIASRGVRFCSRALSYYRSNTPGSLSSRRTRAAWLSAFRSLTLTSERLQSLRPGQAARSAAANAFQRLAYAAYPDEPRLARRCEERAVALGGTDVRPGGGRIFRAVAAVAGWRVARRLQAARARASATDKGSHPVR